MSAFTYMPSISEMVQPYKIFGIVLYAVESVCADENTCTVRKHQHLFTVCQDDAIRYAEGLRNGDVDVF